MNSNIESIRRKYRITVRHIEVSEAEADLRKSAIAGILARLVRRGSIQQPAEIEGE